MYFPISVSTTALLVACVVANPITQQQVLHNDDAGTLSRPATVPRKLNGKFLHITDLHPDPFYKLHSSTAEGIACHRGNGAAGVYGAETSDCDSPFSLVNATFKWIAENIRDEVDFVVWTGDSARHDSDEQAPRSAAQVLTLNNYVASKFIETFADDNHDLTIPIVPTFGNNDILPHNILLAGPNKWLKSYTSVWNKFIPEEQRHGFERGGWFYVEVIPGKLAVFSLNTLYFFDHNSAVDGCSAKSEPGFEHMEWLRIQLQFIRNRGMKAIMMGHVPPARTDSKQLWDETCWQKYTLWLQQYRDVVLGGLFGHMNIDHFLVQDTKQLTFDTLAGFGLDDDDDDDVFVREHLDDELTVQGAADYLDELRKDWSKLPDPSVVSTMSVTDSADEYTQKDGKDDSEEKKKKKKKKESKEEKALRKMGGPWGERFQLTNVAPSVVPNFFPSLRIVEYNLTGLDRSRTWASVRSAALDSSEGAHSLTSALDAELSRVGEILDSYDGDLYASDAVEEVEIERKKKKDSKKPKKPKKPNFDVPSPPAKTAPPGPAYSPQTLTLLGYTQFFANLTHINNDFTPPDSDGNSAEDQSWRKGRHHKKHPKSKDPKPKKFEYEVEYSTFDDKKGFGLQDMTVRSYLKLAHRIGQYSPPKGKAMVDDRVSEGSQQRLVGDLESTSNATVIEDGTLVSQGKKKHRKHRKSKKAKNRPWYTFVKRAFVGIMTDDEVKQFSDQREQAIYEQQSEESKAYHEL